MESTNPFGIYFNLMKIRYSLYDESLTTTNFLQPTDKVNVFINVETALKYLSMSKDLEKKLVVTRNFPEYMKADIINLAAHYKDFFMGNGLQCKVFLYMTDLDSDPDGFKESKYVEDYRSYYLMKYTSNPKFALLGDKFKEEIVPDVKKICEFIPGVYFISAKDIDGGVIPYIIGSQDKGWKNIIISGDIHDTQYEYETNFLDCFYNRSCAKNALGFGTEDFLKLFMKDDNVEPWIVSVFKNAGFYKLLLAVNGDRDRSMDGVKGIKIKNVLKMIRDGLNDRKITTDINNAMMLSDIFPDEIKERVYKNLLALDIRSRVKTLNDGDIKMITGQIMDRSDINSLYQLNRTRFKNNELRLESLLK